MNAEAKTLDREVKFVALAKNLTDLAYLENRRKQTGRGGLLNFVRYFWHVLEPDTEFIEGWPVEAICYHLEAVTFGEINRLLMVVPPGFSKSLMTNVFWPAWIWSAMDSPGTRLLAFSYAASLTERDNERFRRLILSQEFQELWGDKFKLAKVGETKVTNDKTGWKLASSVGGVAGDFVGARKRYPPSWRRDERGFRLAHQFFTGHKNYEAGL
jgi:hypothetical protein